MSADRIARALRIGAVTVVAILLALAWTAFTAKAYGGTGSCDGLPPVYGTDC